MHQRRRRFAVFARRAALRGHCEQRVRGSRKRAPPARTRPRLGDDRHRAAPSQQTRARARRPAQPRIDAMTPPDASTTAANGLTRAPVPAALFAPRPAPGRVTVRGQTGELDGLGSALRQQIDECIPALRALGAARLDAELGERLQRIAQVQQCLCVVTDHGCSGLEPMAPRLHGNLPQDLQRLYATLIVERDPLLARAAQEWRALIGTIDEHCAWLQQQVRNAEVIRAWLTRSGAGGAAHLVVVPARGWLSRGALFAFFHQRPADSSIFALFYAAQRLAVTLELRYRPYTAELLAMRFTAREIDVLRAGLKGAADDEIASRMGLSVDAIRYYFKKFKHRVPPSIGHLKPRELARILHHLGKL
jgi:hypothetical protein